MTGFAEDEVLRLAAAAERGSEHPLADALVQASKERTLELHDNEEFEAVPGRGIAATVAGQRVLAGNLRMLSENGIDTARLEALGAPLVEGARTVVFVAVNGAPAGVIAVADPVKEGAAEAVSALRAHGIRVVLLTGDNRPTALAVAAQVGIDEVIAEVLPADKVERVRELRDAGAVVAMVGDGINDAPALATANVGIAIGTGADVAVEAADVTLMNGDPRGVLGAITLSKATMRTVRQNLFWAFLYNVVLIPIAAGALYPLFRETGVPAGLGFIFGDYGFLNPMLAGAAMAMSSVSVMVNSLRLRGFRTPSAGAHSRRESGTAAAIGAPA
jgi:Cu+-exporting ATPase